MPQNYIGVDVAKNWIDIFDAETGEHRRIETKKTDLRRAPCSGMPHPPLPRQQKRQALTGLPFRRTRY